MKKREITATGTINNNGGLAMYMGELNDFLRVGKVPGLLPDLLLRRPVRRRF